jgi:hypothetical protein
MAMRFNIHTVLIELWHMLLVGKFEILKNKLFFKNGNAEMFITHSVVCVKFQRRSV